MDPVAVLTRKGGAVDTVTVSARRGASTTIEGPATSLGFVWPGLPARPASVRLERMEKRLGWRAVEVDTYVRGPGASGTFDLCVRRAGGGEASALDGSYRLHAGGGRAVFDVLPCSKGWKGTEMLAVVGGGGSFARRVPTDAGSVPDAVPADFGVVWRGSRGAPAAKAPLRVVRLPGGEEVPCRVHSSGGPTVCCVQPLEPLPAGSLVALRAGKPGKPGFEVRMRVRETEPAAAAAAAAAAPAVVPAAAAGSFMAPLSPARSPAEAAAEALHGRGPDYARRRGSGADARRCMIFAVAGHWHYVTSGFSLPGGPAAGGLAELTMRLPRVAGSQPPEWPFQLMLNMSKHLPRAFHGAAVDLRSPLHYSESSPALTAVVLVKDPRLGSATDAQGRRVRFLAVVACTAAELRAATDAQSTQELRRKLRKVLGPLLVNDLQRVE